MVEIIDEKIIQETDNRQLVLTTYEDGGIELSENYKQEGEFRYTESILISNSGVIKLIEFLGKPDLQEKPLYISKPK